MEQYLKVVVILCLANVGLAQNAGYGYNNQGSQYYGARNGNYGSSSSSQYQYQGAPIAYQQNPNSEIQNSGVQTAPQVDIYANEIFGNQVYRPCPDLNIECIRDYFAANAQCTRATGSIPNPLYQQVSNYYYPSVNASLSQIGNAINGLSGRVNNFYVNPTTGLTVLSVAYNEINIVTQTDDFLYYLNGVEPRQGQISSTVYYPEFQITTVFNGNNLNLADSYSVGFYSAVPQVSFYNPTEDQVQDPIFSYLLTQVRSSYGLFVRESFVARAELFTTAFIQYTICNYGLNLNQPTNIPGAF